MADALGRHVDALMATLEGLRACSDDLVAGAAALVATIDGGGTVFVAGNGGSAAEAQHLAGEFVGRLSPHRERPALPAVALTADAISITALANDYGFERIFARQVEGLGRSGDSLVVLSTSGASQNLVEAVAVAKERGMATVGLLGGTRRALHDACDVVVAVPSSDVQTIQECHLALVHVLVELVEDQLTTRR